ncbi:MAG TPA: hypothetical protein VGV14_08985, partial [Rhodanobacter sp.]|nr:hypothetical protein [Rhodanobacter sp.]
MLTSDSRRRPVSAGAERTVGESAGPLAEIGAAMAGTGAELTGKDDGKAASASFAGMIAGVLTGADCAPGCGMPIRSNVRAMPPALIATPAASLYRYALAHADHDIIRVRAHGAIRVSTIRHKAVVVVACHPSSGHMGCNSQSCVDGDGTRGVH